MPDYKSADSVRVYTERDGKNADFAPSFSPDDAYAREIRHFVECIREGRQPRSPGEHGVTLMRIIDALYESAATGREVQLAEPALSLEAV
jgi:predicted dehydrogenase